MAPRPSARRVAFAAALAVLTVALGACGSSEDAGGARPSTSTTTAATQRAALDPRRTVALVQTDAITRVDYDHWHGVARATRPDAPEATVRHDVLQYLVSLVWVRREAQQRHVTVTRAQFEAAVRQAEQRYPTPADYDTFLREHRLTAQDARAQVALSLLQNRLQQSVISAIRSRPAARRQLTRYARRFRARWKGRTTCASGFQVADLCSNG